MANNLLNKGPYKLFETADIGSGAVALGYVPYTGAIKAVDLGVWSLTTPLIYGGSAVGSTLSLQGTSGVGTSSVAAINFLVGNNGATNAAKIYNNSQFEFTPSVTASAGAAKATLFSPTITASALLRASIGYFSRCREKTS